MYAVRGMFLSLDGRTARLRLLGVVVGLGACGCSVVLPCNDCLTRDTAPVFGEHCALPVASVPEPTCNCDSFMPLCKDATWDYAELANFETTKQQKIVGYGDPLQEDYGKTGFDAFEYLRTSNDGTKRSWMTAQDGEVCWHLDHWYNEDGGWYKSKLYEPGRLRMDEGRAEPGASWNEHVTRTVWDAYGSETLDLYQRWTVSWRELIEVPGYPAIRYEHVLCQERVTMPMTDTDDLEHKVFCFARGVGKVYEWDEADKEEYLVSYDIPGCP